MLGGGSLSQWSWFMFRASDAWCDEFQGRPDLSEFTAYQDHEVWWFGRTGQLHAGRCERQTLARALDGRCLNTPVQIYAALTLTPRTDLGVTMEEALQTPEVVRLISDSIITANDKLAFALTQKAFLEPALDSLWSSLTSFRDLYETQTQSSPYDSERGFTVVLLLMSYNLKSFLRTLNRADLKRYRTYYAPRIREFKPKLSTIFSMKAMKALRQATRKPGALSPCIKKLSWFPRDDLEDHLGLPHAGQAHPRWKWWSWMYRALDGLEKVVQNDMTDRPFQSLRYVEIKSRGAQDILGFLQHLATGLRQLRISTFETSSFEALQNTISAIQHHCDTSTLETLTWIQGLGPYDEPLDTDVREVLDITSLLKFRSLKHLGLAFRGVMDVNPELLRRNPHSLASNTLP
ncbi:hypothetical protein FA13DRAFT_1782071 [Coprinellus micaceus]|uniref:Uncharacterized protein n=1 Tax=Coprinellus micaceus TaxID=71717 RepID=A0A4Y7S5K2_COPMI|nr:hypothetical protein FA13DRAFT_1782071 [Coprinellus micaceus]